MIQLPEEVFNKKTNSVPCMKIWRINNVIHDPTPPKDVFHEKYDVFTVPSNSPEEVNFYPKINKNSPYKWSVPWKYDVITMSSPSLLTQIS